MNDRSKLWVIPADFGDQFPDGTYAIGRGADPRLPEDVLRDDAGEHRTKPSTASKSRKSKFGKRKRVARAAAE